MLRSQSPSAVRLVLGALALLLLSPFALGDPEQVHLGLPTSDPSTSLSVLWLDSSPESAPKVTLDAPEGAKEFAGQPVAGPSAGFAYEAKLTGLAPNTSYRYH